MRRYSTLFIIVICLLITFISCGKNFKTLDIIYSSPVNNSIGIVPEFYAEIEFNNEVNRADIEENFSLHGISDVPGGFQWITPKRFRFIPTAALTKIGRYVMELTRSVRDTEGNTMDTDFISEFYIGTDFVPPEIVSSDPAFTNGAAENIPVKQNITVNFTKSMNRESVEKSFYITPDVSGYFIWSENVPGLSNTRFTYTMLSDMTYGKLYTFTVSKSSKDTSGNSLGSDYIVNFITGNDFTPPGVSGIYDASYAQSYWSTELMNNAVNRNLKIAVNFSEAMNRTSVESAFSLTPSVQGNFAWESDAKLLFTPGVPLDPERNYQIYIDKTAKDINGLKLEAIYSVEINTSSSDSLYVRCGNIHGSSDGVAYSLLSTGIPSSSSWPIIITMGVPVLPAPAPQDYYIEIQFVSSLVPYIPVEINKYSVLNNKLVETFKSGPSGIDADSAEIVDVIWTSGSSVIFKLNPLTNKINRTPALYRLTLTGGEGGIKDKNGNYLENDIVIEFREVL